MLSTILLFSRLHVPDFFGIIGVTDGRIAFARRGIPDKKYSIVYGLDKKMTPETPALASACDTEGISVVLGAN